MNGWLVHREPLVAVTVEPRLPGNAAYLGRILEQAATEDPLMSYGISTKSERLIVGSSDVAHLTTLLERLQQELELNIGTPQVQYRETICRSVTEDYTHKGPIGPMPRFARVKLRTDPLPRGTGYDFVHALGLSHPLQRYVDVIAETISDAWQMDTPAGYPLTDMRVILVDGACHETDSDSLTFRKAARQCMRNALSKAQPMLLEPIMRAHVTVDVDFLHAVIGAFLAGRVEVKVAERERDLTIVRAQGPLVSLLPYAMPTASAPTWQSFTMTLEFDGYMPAPYHPDSEGPHAGAMALRRGAWLA